MGERHHTGDDASEQLRGPRRRAIALALFASAWCWAPAGALAAPPDVPVQTVLTARALGDPPAVVPRPLRLSLAPEPEAVGAPPAEEVIEDPPPIAPKVYWNPDWPTFSTGEWILTGASIAAIIGSEVLNATPASGSGRLGVDESVRSALRPGSRDGQHIGGDISDVGLTVMAAFPFAIDALAIAGWYRRNPEVALQMALIDAEALALTVAITSLTKVFVGRERPYGRECGGLIPGSVDDCVDDDRYRSFLSGHSSVAFTSAGLICSHHVNLQLLGDPTAEAWTCAAAFLGAGLTATFRIVGDKHYFTDTLTGALLGTVVGLGVPWLFHYRHGKGDPESPDDADDVKIQLMPTPMGAFAAGTF